MRAAAESIRVTAAHQTTRPTAEAKQAATETVGPPAYHAVHDAFTECHSMLERLAAALATPEEPKS